MCITVGSNSGCRCGKRRDREDQGVRLRDNRGADVLAGQGQRRGVPGDLQGRRAGVSNDGDRAVLRAVHRARDTGQGLRENIPRVRRTGRPGKLAQNRM